jgi:hypothetical protein
MIGLRFLFSQGRHFCKLNPRSRPRNCVEVSYRWSPSWRCTGPLYAQSAEFPHGTAKGTDGYSLPHFQNRPFERFFWAPASPLFYVPEPFNNWDRWHKFGITGQRYGDYNLTMLKDNGTGDRFNYILYTPRINFDHDRLVDLIQICLCLIPPCR